MGTVGGLVPRLRYTLYRWALLNFWCVSGSMPDTDDIDQSGIFIETVNLKQRWNHGWTLINTDFQDVIEIGQPPNR